MYCYKAVVFDFDGTLFDTESHERKTLAALVEQVTGCYPSEEKLLNTFGMTGPQAMQYLGCNAKQMEWVWPRWYDASVKALETTPMFGGIKETILQLNARNIPLGIVTSRNIGGVRVGLCAHQMLQAFAEIVCQEDTEQHKPAPDPLLECAKRLQVEPAQLLYVGDSAVDMQCAKSAGARSGLALWGTHEPELECDFQFDRPEEILTLFQE